MSTVVEWSEGWMSLLIPWKVSNHNEEMQKGSNKQQIIKIS